jgi:hypothetical protein
MISFDPVVFIAVATSSPDVGNCYPFGGGLVGWGSYFFGRYTNLPAATINVGDLICFDTVSVVASRPAFASIALATPANEVYSIIVGDSAALSNGNTVVGDCDLCFTVTAGYTFAGGDLLIRFNGGGFAGNSNGWNSISSCNPTTGGGLSSDQSG